MEQGQGKGGVNDKWNRLLAKQNAETRKRKIIHYESLVSYMGHLRLRGDMIWPRGHTAR